MLGRQMANEVCLSGECTASGLTNFVSRATDEVGLGVLLVQCTVSSGRLVTKSLTGPVKEDHGGHHRQNSSMAPGGWWKQQLQSRTPCAPESRDTRRAGYNSHECLGYLSMKKLYGNLSIIQALIRILLLLLTFYAAVSDTPVLTSCAHTATTIAERILQAVSFPGV